MTHGKGKDFKKFPPVPTENLTDGHLQLLLFEAERAWAYSQELIALSRQPSVDSRKARTLRHSATGRFRRSVHWATQLLSHSQTLHSASRLSTNSLIQASVYILILNGRFLRYREEYQDALKQLSVARHLLDILAATAGTSRDQALATLFSDEIGPEIRHCAHELGHKKAYDIDGIVAELAPKFRDSLVEGCSTLIEELKKTAGGGDATHGKGGSRQLKELRWEGQPVQIRNPELVDLLLKVQEAETKLGWKNASTSGGAAGGGKKGIAAFDAVLSALSDASDLAKKLADSKSSGPSGPLGARDNHFVYAFLVYHLLSRRIQRDLLLVSSILSETSRPQKDPKNLTTTTPTVVDPRVYPGLVKLLDATLQSLTQMRSLTIVDEASPDLAASIDARISFTKARRCLYLSRCYASPFSSSSSNQTKFAEAIILIQRGNLHIRAAKANLDMVVGDEEAADDSIGFTSSSYPLIKDDLTQLEEMMNKEIHGYKKDWFAFNGGNLTSSSPSSSTTTFKKPTFFDIALNYLELDMDSLNEKAGKEVLSTNTMTSAGMAPATVSEKRSQPVVDDDKGRSIKSGNLDSGVAERATATTATPATTTTTRGGLGSLLGGWWGRS